MIVQKGQVFVWSRNSNGGWQSKELRKKTENSIVWSVSWSPVGTVLSAAIGDNEVELWRETVDGRWEPTNFEALQIPDVEPAPVETHPMAVIAADPFAAAGDGAMQFF